MFGRFARLSKPKVFAASAASLGAATVGIAVATAPQPADCSDDAVHPPHYGWPFDGPFSSQDTASIRRGFQVYREVCATCHSIQYIHFRNLVGVTHTAAAAKAIAEEYDVEDGPNDEGEMYERPGKPVDVIPGPYRNDEAARAANNGAVPPDLSLMTKARDGGVDYMFALLTGYCEPPEGKAVMPGLQYNPYFPGGAIAMPPPLVDGAVEYEDGTPATVSQMAKDVTCFLQWCAEPEHDVRKAQGMQVILGLLACIALTGYYKRLRWAPLKTRKIEYWK